MGSLAFVSHMAVKGFRVIGFWGFAFWGVYVFLLPSGGRGGLGLTGAGVWGGLRVWALGLSGLGFRGCGVRFRVLSLRLVG